MGLLTTAEIAAGIGLGFASVCFVGAVSMAFATIRRVLDETVSD